jgi:ribosomal protein S18 acetylase RimI-like enzyme
MPVTRVIDSCRLLRWSGGEGQAVRPARCQQLSCRDPCQRGDLHCMDHAAVLAAFNQQVRQSTSPDGTGAVFERDRFVIRRLAQPGQQGSGIFWSDLDTGSADAVIAAQVALFASRRETFEWKLYSYDMPADLAERLFAAGLVPEPPESLMIAAVGAVIRALSSAELPAGVRLERVTGADGLAQMARVERIVFDREESELRQSLLAQQTADPGILDLVVAMAGEEPICAARTEFLPGTDFAGLWGGGTLPNWRRRGIYRAVVRYRAELAAARGYQYLTVDASPESRPILEHVGFDCVAITTPYIWTANGGRLS